MRFFVSSSIKRNKPLYYAVVLFLAFAFIFWMASWLHFYTKYGFSRESLVRYFFMDPEFPERISLSQISEDFHVGVFMHGVMLITLFSLLSITHWKSMVKLALILFTSLFMLFYLLSDFIILVPSLAPLKLLSFLLYQLAYLLLILAVLLGILYKDTKPDQGPLKVVVFIFSILSLFFVLSNVLNFYSKMGFSPQGIRDYFLGNPNLFIKKKSFDGLFKVFYPHLIAMAIYSLIHTHLLPFAGLSKNKSLLLGIFIFLFSFLDNLSSLMLLYAGYPIAYLKLLSFWLLQACLLTSSLILLKASLKRGSYPSLYI
ncbi:MAG: hypothetical protein ACK4FY_05655 [Aquificaceae bacterium]